MPRKRCSACGQEKSTAGFSKCSSHKDGLASHCKDCAATYRQKWATMNIAYLRHVKLIDYTLHAERYKALERKRRNANPDCRKEESRRRMEHHGEAIRRYSAIYREKHKKAKSAASKVRSAVKNGLLTKPDTCTLCGSSRNLRAHHSNYDKPLDVLWVCESCHRIIHLKEAQNEAAI